MPDTATEGESPVGGLRKVAKEVEDVKGVAKMTSEDTKKGKVDFSERTFLLFGGMAEGSS